MREAARGLKKVILELGGSDPFIVLEDADVGAAAKAAAAGRFMNCGQSCIAAKRFFVADAIAPEFLEKLADAARGYQVGDPLDPKTDVGPLSSRSQRDAIEVQVKDAARRGANVVVGGRRWGKRGYFYEPTVLSGVTPEMRVLREETFGPAAPVTTFRTLDEAIAQANATEFGLGASLWTRDLDRAREIARRIQSGMVTVNNVVKSDPRMPFGGVKKSGIGRELSRYGLLEMCNIKSVVMYAP
jgi:succinate-semialdehyde dehydrogenase/glutarate-semialdehyde dehydrogenase/succinyl-CoA reductase